MLSLITKYSKHLLFISAGCLMLAIPLLRDFHVESAIIVGVIGCFWAGLKTSRSFNKTDFFNALNILGFLFLFGIPLFLYSLLTGCLTIDGVGFWLLIPFPSVFFGTAVGRVIREFNFPYPLFTTSIVLIFCAVVVWLIELFTFPQVYFFNHVWGNWPGPIYDEAVHLTGSLFYFRWLTFLWIILLWVLPSWNKNKEQKLITGLTVLALMLSYLNLDEMGIVSPHETIQQQLGSLHQTEHFNIYYDQGFFSEEELQYWAKRHEFYFQQIIQELEIDWPSEQRIDSYLYNHAWQKKRITGAKFTSYVPVWLRQDQLHIAKQHLEAVLKHELVHVVSKQFGNRLLNASLSIGLIEGLAEAIAKDASDQSTLHQIVASEKPYPTTEEMKSSLSLYGFYGSAGAISYSTSGSFVRYLLDEYPVPMFKKAYPAGEFEDAYSRPFDELVAGWHQVLDETEIDSLDLRISEFIFAQRSLFQKPCPHSVSRELRLWDEYRFHLADNDTAKALDKLGELFAVEHENELVQAEWIRTQLREGNYSAAIDSVSPPDSNLTLQLLYADALIMHGNLQKADSLLQSVVPEIKKSDAVNFRYSDKIRENHLNWLHHTKRKYSDFLPDSSGFETINIANKVQFAVKAAEQQQNKKLISYSSILVKEEPNPDWFEMYAEIITRLIYIQEFELAEKWITNISSMNLRLRYQEKLENLKEWYHFNFRSQFSG